LWDESRPAKTLEDHGVGSGGGGKTVGRKKEIFKSDGEKKKG